MNKLKPFVTVLKYDNRKLYLKDFSRYTTLKELEGLIADNVAVFAFDHRTLNDITDELYKTILSRQLRRSFIDRKELEDAIKTNFPSKDNVISIFSGR